MAKKKKGSLVAKIKIPKKFKKTRYFFFVQGSEVRAVKPKRGGRKKGSKKKRTVKRKPVSKKRAVKRKTRRKR